MVRFSRLLLRLGANVNLTESYSRTTALRVAAERGYVELVKVLLDAGADASISDRSGETALEAAICKKHWGIVFLLLRESPHVWSKLMDVL